MKTQWPKVLVRAVGQEKETKDIQTVKKELKLSLFSGNMILYIENPRFHQNTIKTNEEFNKAAGYKINIQKSIVSLYTNNDWKEKLRNNFMYKSIKMNKLPTVNGVGIHAKSETRSLSYKTCKNKLKIG